MPIRLLFARHPTSGVLPGRRHETEPLLTDLTRSFLRRRRDFESRCRRSKLVGRAAHLRRRIEGRRGSAPVLDLDQKMTAEIGEIECACAVSDGAYRES